MKRHELEHIIRAAGAVTEEDDFVVIGSQAILGSVITAPPELLYSMEADLFPLHRPEKADEIEGSIGELSQFHETYSYYAQGVGPETAVLAEGWRDRLVPLKNENTDGRTGWCLEATDLAVSKLIAFREKDRDFVGAMLDHGLIDIEQVVDRLAKVPGEEKRRLVARQWIVSRRSSI